MVGKFGESVSLGSEGINDRDCTYESHLQSVWRRHARFSRPRSRYPADAMREDPVMIESARIGGRCFVLVLIAGMLGGTVHAASLSAGPSLPLLSTCTAVEGVAPPVMPSAPADTTEQDPPKEDRVGEDPSANDRTEPDRSGQEPTPADSDAGFERTAGDDAWTLVTTARGVEITYIHYIQADSHNDGVVLRLRNQTLCPAEIRFTVVFRSKHREVAAPYATMLQAGEMKTGEASGLFWIPFPDGRSVAEIGLRGLSVEWRPDAATSNGSGPKCKVQRSL